MAKAEVGLSEEGTDNMDVGNSDAAAIRLGWSWKRETLQVVKAKITVYVRYSIINDIQTVLQRVGDEVYQRFVDSCFGHFMGFHSDAYSCNAALHAILAREINKTDAADDEIWFRIGEQSIRFSKYEYALVTGLRFGDSTFVPSDANVPPAGGVYRRYLCGKSVSVDRLWNMFTNDHFRESAADALSVAKVLFLYCMLLGVDMKKTSVNHWVWALVEDIDRWESFPWGKYTFQTLLRYIRNVPTSISEDRVPTYHFYGFLVALLIWAYEAIPQLGNYCGDRVPNNARPRCLRWRLPKTMAEMTGFFDRQIECFVTLSPSIEEQQMDYWQHIDEPLSSGAQYVHRKNPFRRLMRSMRAGGTASRTVARGRVRSRSNREASSKRQRIGPSLTDAAPILDNDRGTDVRGRSFPTSHNGPNELPVNIAHKARIDPTEGIGHDAANDVHDIHDISIDTDWGRLDLKLGFHDVPLVSNESSLLTRPIQGLTPVIQQEVERVVAVALERHFPTIIQRELSFFFQPSSTEEQPSPLAVAATTAPSDDVPSTSRPVDFEQPPVTVSMPYIPHDGSPLRSGPKKTTTSAPPSPSGTATYIIGTSASVHTAMTSTPAPPPAPAMQHAEHTLVDVVEQTTTSASSPSAQVVYTDGIEKMLNLRKCRELAEDISTYQAQKGHSSARDLSSVCPEDDMDARWHVGKKRKGDSFDLMTGCASPTLSKYQRVQKLEAGIAPIDSKLSPIRGDDGLLTVNGYKIKTTTAPVLEAVFAKYGDIMARCIYRSASVRASLLEVVCDVVRRLQHHDFEAILNDLEVIENEVSDVEASKIKVSWLHEHLSKLRKVAAFRKKTYELRKTKEKSSLITEAASNELKQRHAELLLAQERFKEAEKRVNAMRLVSRKIDDDILESESEEYFWKRRVDDLL